MNLPETIAALERAVAKLHTAIAVDDRLALEYPGTHPGDAALRRKSDAAVLSALTDALRTGKFDVENEQWNPPRPGSNVPIMCQKCKGKGWVPA